MQILREYRQRAGLTQQALADLSTVSARTIRDLEAGRARARRRTAELLADGLRLTGLGRETFLDDHRAHAAQSWDWIANMSPPAPVRSLFGRESVVSTVAAALGSDRHRVVSISGLGGVGKSSIVVEVARLLHRHLRWPVLWFGDTQAGASWSATSLEREIQEVIEVGGTLDHRLDRLINNHDLLIVIDGLESFPFASSTIEKLVQRCPGVRVLLTSRISVPTGRFYEVHVPPLPVPRGGRVGLWTPSTLAHCPSVCLLVDELNQASPGYTLTESDVPAIITLCRRMDGIPLALRLAAIRSRVFSVRDLAYLPVGEVLEFLVEPDGEGRALTLADVIGATQSLLDETQLEDLATLADLKDPWTIDDASVVLEKRRCEVVELMAALVRAGFIRVVRDGRPTRFLLLSLVSALARRNLEPPVWQRRAGMTSVAKRQRGQASIRRD